MRHSECVSSGRPEANSATVSAINRRTMPFDVIDGRYRRDSEDRLQEILQSPSGMHPQTPISPPLPPNPSPDFRRNLSPQPKLAASMSFKRFKTVSARSRSVSPGKGLLKAPPRLLTPAEALTATLKAGGNPRSSKSTLPLIRRDRWVNRPQCPTLTSSHTVFDVHLFLQARVGSEWLRHVASKPKSQRSGTVYRLGLRWS